MDARERTKVGDRDPIVRIDKDVAGCKVAVDQAGVMHGLDGIADLPKPMDDLLRRNVRNVLQRASVDPLADDVMDHHAATGRNRDSG